MSNDADQKKQVNGALLYSIMSSMQAWGFSPFSSAESQAQFNQAVNIRCEVCQSDQKFLFQCGWPKCSKMYCESDADMLCHNCGDAICSEHKPLAKCMFCHKTTCFDANNVEFCAHAGCGKLTCTQCYHYDIPDRSTTWLCPDHGGAHMYPDHSEH